MSDEHLTTLLFGRSAVRNGLAKSLRTDAGLSQAEIADLIGVSSAAVSRWEAGDRVPRGESGRRYCALLARLARETEAPVQAAT